MTQVVQDGKRERLARTVATASLVVSSIYIAWRWGWTLDLEHPWFSVPLALAETYGLLGAAMLTYTAWRLAAREVPRPLPGRSVDVLVTVADEPLATIRKTVLAAREIRYPHTTWLLDDGHRDELRTVADELGVRYLRRADRAGGKAGNLNHALAHTTGEFLLQLDADHVALPQIVDRLIGFFQDPRTAFVQSPQDFYNTDAFSDDSSGQGRQLWGDQQLFFNVLEPGKDRANAAIFVGSCALLRRAALEDVGGFGTHSSTMGTETSLLLHARGWRSVYLNENLAFGLAPATAHAYQKQQLHRAQGGMQLLRRYPPFALPGLTRAQRIEYFETLSSPLGSVQRLILYLAPIVFLTTGVFPIRASLGMFAILFVPMVLLRAAAFRLLTRGQGSLLLTDRYWMAKWFTHLLALRAFVLPSRLHYRERPDEAGAVPLRTVAPQLVLITLTAAALAWATYARTLGYSGEVPGWGLIALFGAVGLALWHAGIAAHVVQLSLAGRHRRAEYRFAESLSVALRVLRPDGKLSSSDIAVTDDLTSTGLALRCMYPIPERARVELSLPLSGGEVQVRGHVVRHATSETQLGTVHLAGVEFDGISRETRDAIELHCAQHAMPLERQRHRPTPVAGRAVRRLRNLRVERRVAVGMPARVLGGSEEAFDDLGVGLLEDVSPRGGRILVDHPIAQGTRITLVIPGSTVRASGTVVFVHALETGMGTRFVAGFESELAAAVAAEPAAAPWYAGVLRLAARTAAAARSGTVATAATAATVARGTRTVAARVAGSSSVVAGQLASESRATASRLAAGTRVAAARLTNGARTAPAGAAEAARPAAGTLPAATRATVQRLSAGSRAAASRMAAISRVAGERMAADLRADALRAVDTARAVRTASATAAALASQVMRDALPARAGAAGRSLDGHPLAPVEEVARADRELAAARVAAAEAAAIAAAAARRAAAAEQAGLLAAEAPAMEPVAAAIGEPDPDRAIEMQIDGDFSFPFELTVGATLLIGETGHVQADIAAVHAVVLGQYTGTLRATRSIRVGPRARVEGALEAPEVVIAEGAVVNGLAAAGEPAAASPAPSPAIDLPPVASSGSDGGAIVPSTTAPDAPGSARVVPEQPATQRETVEPAPETPEDEIFVASPIFTEGVSRG